MSNHHLKLLVIDDNPRIHEDFRKIFREPTENSAFLALQEELFGSSQNLRQGHHYNIDCFSSGEDAQRKVVAELKKEQHYPVAFIDMRMPGWDGIKTTQKLWEIDPDIQIVICTAYMDHSWESIVQQLGEERSFLILKKPFEVIEVKQLAQMLSSKWMAMQNERKTFKNLENALRAKDIFMARVSHELRTPLHGIIGVIDLLKETKLNEQQIDFVQTLNCCGENLDRIIDDILDYSALEDGRFSLEISEFNIHEFFYSIRKQFRFETISRGIDLNVDFDEEIPPWLMGDTTRLHQIFGNLLRNAFKFTEEGTVALKASMGTLLDGRACIEAEISDTGVGIPKAYMDYLFTPFSQAENVNKRRFGGNGLGLAICKALIESMGGQITVKSEVGVGTAVQFVLSLEISNKCHDSTNENKIAPVGTKNEDSVPQKTSLKILAVDDSHTNRKVIKNQLFWMGHHCITAGSCEEAIEMLGTHDVEFIFMDCQMPQIDGFETTKKIRSLFPEYVDVPIVALTANIDQSTQEMCEKVGMNGFVSKPARRMDLQSKIDELLVKI